MSGSTDAATIAERTKLEAQLREAQEGLDDTYYNHAMDSHTSALDDELEAFEKSHTDYLEELRESIKDTEQVIEEVYQQVMSNADIVLSTINTLSSEYGFTIEANLLSPWQNAALVADAFKTGVGDGLSSLVNEDGVVTLFGAYTTDLLQTTFGSGSTAAEAFKGKVGEYIGNIKMTLENSKGKLKADLEEPWNEAGGEGGAVYTFSEYVKKVLNDSVKSAQDKYTQMKTALEKPWLDSKSNINTFYTNITTMLDNAVDKAVKAGKQIEAALNVKAPNYTGGASGGSSGDTGGGSGGNNGSGITTKPLNNLLYGPSKNDIIALQNCLNMLFSAGLNVDGQLGPATKLAIAKAQKTMYLAGNEAMKSQDGLYGLATRTAMIGYIDKKIASLRSQGGSSMIGQGIQRYNTIKNMLPKAFSYAKGTLGTKKDGLAYTDEPWLGDELVLVPGKNGNLQYMRKGTAVIPADISANLMEWGKLNPNMDMSNAIQGVNLMTNVISKPELNLSFDALVKAESITEETLPAVKRLVTEELDKFSRQLNYSLRRVGAK